MNKNTGCKWLAKQGLSVCERVEVLHSPCMCSPCHHGWTLASLRLYANTHTLLQHTLTHYFHALWGGWFSHALINSSFDTWLPNEEETSLTEPRWRCSPSLLQHCKRCLGWLYQLGLSRNNSILPFCFYPPEFPPSPFSPLFIPPCCTSLTFVPPFSLCTLDLCFSVHPPCTLHPTLSTHFLNRYSSLVGPLLLPTFFSMQNIKNTSSTPVFSLW